MVCILLPIPETAVCVGEVERKFLFRFLKMQVVVEIKFITVAIIIDGIIAVAGLKRSAICCEIIKT